MKYSNGSAGRDLVTPDDALSETQLERFPGEPEKNRIQAPGHEEWIYDDGTRVYSAEAYGFLSDLVEDDVLDGDKALTGVDREMLRDAAVQVKGVRSPVAWVDEDSYEKGNIDEGLPVDGRFYFQGEIPMSVQMRGSDDLANRLSFLQSAQDTDVEYVMDDVDQEDIDEESRGMIDRIDARLTSRDFVVPIVYSEDGHPVERRRVAFVYRPENQSGLTDDFSNFVRALSDRKEDALKAEVESRMEPASGESKASIDPGMPDRPPELRELEGGDGYQLNFYAKDYEDASDWDVEMRGDEIRVYDGGGSEVAARDVEFDEELEASDLEDISVEGVDVNNGVATAVLSED
jgi:hypothetical protein